MGLHVGVEIPRPLQDLDDGPQPGRSVLPAAEETVDDGPALDVYRIEGDCVTVRVRLLSGSYGVLDRLPFREEGRFDQQVRFDRRPGRVRDLRRVGMFLEAPHLVDRKSEDAVVRRFEAEGD